MHQGFGLLTVVRGVSQQLLQFAGMVLLLKDKVPLFS